MNRRSNTDHEDSGSDMMNERIYIVSGLPRSGTSMMMQMLASGGIPPLTDGARKPDADNPNGYFEFEDVKSIEADATWLGLAVGKATKMVSVLLPKLPPVRRYHVIFMRRDLDEILASQKAMLERSGKIVGESEQDDLRRFFAAHLRQIVEWLIKAEHIEVTFVKYADVLSQPRRIAGALKAFTGVDLDVRNMVDVVDPALYRRRSGAG